MPYKVSSAPEDAFHMSGKFADGWGVITDARAIVFQFAPTTEEGAKKTGRAVGTQDPPALYCELTIQRYQDGEGNKSPTPPETKMLGMQKPTMTTDVPTLELTPGEYVDGDLDTEPVDKGGGLGAEGNTVVAQREGYQLNDKCGWMTFATSLTEAGFKPAVLKRTYFPDLIGLYAYFETKTLPKFRDSMSNDPTAFIVQKGSIKVYPYEKAAGAVGTGGTSKVQPKKGAGKAANAAAPVDATKTTTPSNGAPAIDATDLATAVVQSLAAKKKGGVLTDRNRLMMEVMMAVNMHKPPVPPEMKKPVIDQLRDMDWLLGVGMAYELFDEQEDRSIKFS